MTKRLAILVLGIVSQLATSCGSSVDKTPSGIADVNQLLTPDATGWIDKSTTGTTGIQGQWHARADSRFPIPGDRVPNCQTTKYGECSIVDEPAPGSTFAPTAGLGMCTSGIIARWISGSDGITPDGSPGWAGIVLELNMPDWPERNTSANAPTGQPFDADAQGVTGFAFDIDSEPAPGASVLVQAATVGRDGNTGNKKPAYWRSAHPDQSPVYAGHNEFVWDDVGPSPFDKTQILRIAFLVTGNDAHAVAYSFCINNLTALRKAKVDSGLQDQLLVPDANGWVGSKYTGTTNIQGAWFAAADGMDGLGSIGECQKAGYATSECSVFSEPSPPSPFSPDKDQRMCTAGIVAQIIAGSDGGMDWSSFWGALIAFNLNETDPPEWHALPFDAVYYRVTGFAFDIDSEPPPGAEIKVELTTLGTEGSPAYWGGDAALSSPVHAGHNEFWWSDVGGPYYNSHPPQFDASKITQIAFHVSGNTMHAVSYSFCIKNLTALRH